MNWTCFLLLQLDWYLNTSVSSAGSLLSCWGRLVHYGGGGQEELIGPQFGKCQQFQVLPDSGFYVVAWVISYVAVVLYFDEPILINCIKCKF